jgi:hypothetical protein
VVVDDGAAKLTGEWKTSRAAPSYIGDGYQHDHAAKNGRASARFEARLPAAGRYEVRLAYPPNTNRSSKTKVTVEHAGGAKSITLNQQESPPIDGAFVSLGTFEFDASRHAAVTVSNDGADGYVVVDAVQWLPAAK